MVCNHDQSLRKVDVEEPVLGATQLPLHAFVSTDPDHGRAKPLRKCNDQQAKGLFRQSHICIVIIPIDQVQRSSKELSQRYAEDTRKKPGGRD